MAALKTQQSEASVEAFLDSLPDPDRQADARALYALMADVSGEPAKLWGASLIGFGRYAYRYDSGQSGEWFRVGFSPRKAETTLYLHLGGWDADPLLARLGKHKTGKGCLYLKRVADADPTVLRALIEGALAHMAWLYPA
jgi:hypothetical protein